MKAILSNSSQKLSWLEINQNADCNNNNNNNDRLTAFDPGQPG